MENAIDNTLDEIMAMGVPSIAPIAPIAPIVKPTPTVAPVAPTTAKADFPPKHRQWRKIFVEPRVASGIQQGLKADKMNRMLMTTLKKQYPLSDYPFATETVLAKEAADILEFSTYLASTEHYYLADEGRLQIVNEGRAKRAEVKTNADGYIVNNYLTALRDKMTKAKYSEYLQERIVDEIFANEPPTAKPTTPKVKPTPTISTAKPTPTEAKTVAQTVANNYSAALTSALAKLEAEDNPNYISAETVNRLASAIAERLTAPDLEGFNKSLRKKGRGLTYYEIALIGCIHRRSILENDKSASPFRRISGLAAQSGLLDKSAPLDNRQIRYALTILETIGFTVAVAPADFKRHQAATWAMGMDDFWATVFD